MSRSDALKLLFQLRFLFSHIDTKIFHNIYYANRASSSAGAGVKVLLLGAYGLVGTSIARSLMAARHRIVGVGRSIGPAQRRMPWVTWIEADIAAMRTADDWAPLLAGVEAVVNAAGVLQHSRRDNLTAVHYHAITALIAACEKQSAIRFVQISAPDAVQGATTGFYRTKAAADAELRRSSLHWIILRPALVVSTQAYGGTALLRAVAGFPAVMPLAFGGRPLATVSAHDVAEAVRLSIEGSIPAGTDCDLVEDRARTLAEAVGLMRAWLGYGAAPSVRMPMALVKVLAKASDGLALLGWRSPLRTTALAAMANGVSGNPEPWRRLTGRGMRPLEETLADLPSTVQERWFARLWLLKPLVIGGLSLTWLVSGAVGLARLDVAAAMLEAAGLPQNTSAALVIGGSAVDIALGALLLHRRTVRLAAAGMMAMTGCYLLAASILMPALWIDPLGPLVKTIPMIALAAVALAIAEER